MIPIRFFWLFDFLTLLIAFAGAYYLLPVLHTVLGGGNLSWGLLFAPANIVKLTVPPLFDWLYLFFIMAPIILVVLGAMGNHRPIFQQSRARIILGSFVAPLIAFAPVTIVGYALRDTGISRLFVFSFIGLSFLGLAGSRFILRQYFIPRKAAGTYAKNVVFIGLQHSIEWIVRYFLKNIPSGDYQFLGYLSVSSDQTGSISISDLNNPGIDRIQVNLLGKVQELGDLLIHKPIHEVVAIIPTGNGDWIEEVVQSCDRLGVSLRVVPEILLFKSRDNLKTIYPLKQFFLPAVVLHPPHLDSESLFFKRLLDFIISGVLLAILSPVFALIALAIKISTPKLPVFYPWRVIGQNGVEFTGYKFTTMFPDADQHKEELLPKNEMNGPVFKIKDDPRVTPLGKILRKFSLNELPQLWSVLKGDMSLVGPRPAFRHELDRYDFWHKRKLSIKPGITCFWQIRGRNKINNFDDWVRMDLEYIDNWSLWLDFKILVRTVWVVVKGTGC